MRLQRSIRGGISFLDALGIDIENFDTSMILNTIRSDEVERLGADLEQRFSVTNATDRVKEELEQQIPEIDEMLQRIKYFGQFTFKEFDTKEDLEAYIADERIGSTPEWGGLCFGFMIHENDNKNKYELELFYNDLWPGWLKAIPNQKKKVYNSYTYSYKQNEFLDYTQSGFTHLQNWVANTILKRKTGIDTASIVAMAIPSKLPPYTVDDFGQLINGILAFSLFIMYIPPLFRTTYRIVAEKENKVKESMRMMGLQDFAYWASWYTYYTIVNTVLATIVWAILIA